MKRKSRIQLRNFLLIAMSFAFVSLLIYYTRGVTIYWHLYAIPLIIAAFTYNVVGGLIVGLAGTSMIAGWMYYFAPYLYSINESVPLRTLEISLGGILYITMGIALGFLAKKQKEQQAILERLSVHDRLTGLYNYSYFIDKLDEEKKRADRYGHPFSLVMFDIDFFKMLNDTFGHEAGNIVLKKIGEIIHKNVRNIDVVSRYGGEEFAILLPHVVDNEACRVAERIRKAIEGTGFNLRNGDPTVHKVTISGGLATYPKDARNETELIVNADRALYKAKESGRNRVCVFSQSPELLSVINFSKH